VRALEQNAQEYDHLTSKLREKCELIGLRRFAEQAAIAPGNLPAILNGRHRAKTDFLRGLLRVKLQE
jgi:hypothetical protein